MLRTIPPPPKARAAEHADIGSLQSEAQRKDEVPLRRRSGGGGSPSRLNSVSYVVHSDSDSTDGPAPSSWLSSRYNAASRGSRRAVLARRAHPLSLRETWHTFYTALRCV